MLENSERIEDRAPLARTLMEMRKHEKIPASERRAAIRARLLEAFGEMRLTVFETRIGWIGAAYSARGLVALQLPRATRSQTLFELKREFPEGVVSDAQFDDVIREMREYAEGRRREFDLLLDWSPMRPFQRAVLETISRIPFGETRTYAWVAREIGKPRATRAVGQALGANPIPIILPCHRVIGSDGGLHGYGGGLPMKAMLLRLEGAAF